MKQKSEPSLQRMLPEKSTCIIYYEPVILTCDLKIIYWTILSPICEMNIQTKILFQCFRNRKTKLMKINWNLVLCSSVGWPVTVSYYPTETFWCDRYSGNYKRNNYPIKVFWLISNFHCQLGSATQLFLSSRIRQCLLCSQFPNNPPNVLIIN